MFVDELTIEAKAGDGGDGVVRWHHEKFKPRGGPSGGNGGRGGDVYMRAVSDTNRLAQYTGKKSFSAQSGEPGRKQKQHGHNGDDLYIDVPIGSVVTDTERGRRFELLHEGETVKILQGGSGGLGNVHFKSSTNTSPEQQTNGKPGEAGQFTISVELAVDIGLIGLPNAGKSSLLNTLTNAKSAVGSYAFTTTEPHLGAFGSILIADIPGLIEGAATGKGLGHKFLKHISRTQMLLHVLDITSAHLEKDYYTISNELANYSPSLIEKEEWIIFTKKDLVDEEYIAIARKLVDKLNKRVFFISNETEEGVPELRSALLHRDD